LDVRNRLVEYKRPLRETAAEPKQRTLAVAANNGIVFENDIFMMTLSAAQFLIKRYR